MNGCRSVLRALALVAAAGFLSAGACAEKVSSAQWHFTAEFPCQTSFTGKNVDAHADSFVLNMYSCENDSGAFFVGINDYPPGSVTPENSDRVYQGVVEGQASHTGGTLRSVQPVTLGALTGREDFIDLMQMNGAARGRVFLVGDRLYQLLCVGPKGMEEGQKCLDFLNSFAFLP